MAIKPNHQTLKAMRHGSLFSGIGGFDLAAEWIGWENIFHCEWNEFGRKILKHYWPNAKSYGDITKTDFTIHRGEIDILTGGFPCQPYSVAGKRKGKDDDRHLWPEMLRAIREIQPRYVVGENVRGLTNWNGGLVFDEVQADLEAEGYEVLPFLLPACAVNAPHRRDRIWFIAHAKSNRNRRIISGMEGTNDSQREPEKYREDNNEFRTNGEVWDASNTTSSRLERIRNDGLCSEKKQSQFTRLGPEQFTTNPNSIRQQKSGELGRSSNTETSSDWKEYRTFNDGEWQTEPPVCFRNDGVSERLDGITISKWEKQSIMGAGNAIVPQVAHQIFKAIEQYEINTQSHE